MELILEIRPAEGGDDAKLFAHDLKQAYIKMASIQCWKVDCL